MKFKLIIIASSLVLALIACGEKAVDQSKSAQSPAAPSNSSAKMHTGKVLETMNAGGYTYVEIEENGEKIWAAGMQTTIAKGEQVSFPDGMLMENFESKTLNKKFDKIYFVSSLKQDDSAKSIPIEKPAHNATETAKIVVGSISKATGGYTISECYSQKKSLAGKTIKVHAKIVKYTPQIMGKNWIHLQDGTGTEGSNDLTITTTKNFEKGQTILVTGVLQTDKSIGAGYNFPIMMENPEIEIK